MLFIALVAGLALEAPAVGPATNVAPLIISGRQSAHPAGTYSAGIAEIIKMLEAKVDAQVILAYIQNSAIPYNPEATELVALKEHGASTATLLALLHRGDELRLQLAQAESSVDPPSAPLTSGYVPETAYPPYPNYDSDSSDVPYPPTYYGYGAGWPWAYRPNVRITVHPPYEDSQEHARAPGGGRTGPFTPHSDGSRASSHSGGRSGGRSR